MRGDLRTTASDMEGMMIDSLSSSGLGSAPFGQRPSFLASHRALAVCSRELGRLTTDVVRGAAMLGSDVEQKSVERLSPGRCIVQLGPVALTLTWLRSTIDSVADGDLLVIVWRGAVAPRAEHLPERMTTRRQPIAATALWEGVFVAAGSDEASWTWQAKDAGAAGYSSADLAAQCVERLRTAYEACRIEGAAPPVH